LNPGATSPMSSFRSLVGRDALVDAAAIVANDGIEHGRGWSAAEVADVKLHCCQVLQAVGHRCRLRQPAIATAIVYFRRFFAEQSILEHDPLLIGIASLWAASKVEDVAVAAKAIVREAMAILQQQPMAPAEQCYEAAHVIAAEPVLLRSLGFALLVAHPFDALARLLKQHLTAAAAVSTEPSSRVERDNLIHTAHALLNDCYRTDACICYPPLALALCCLHTAGELLNLPLQLPSTSAELQQHVEAAAASLHALYERCHRLQPKELAATRDRLSQHWTTHGRSLAPVLAPVLA